MQLFKLVLGASIGVAAAWSPAAGLRVQSRAGAVRMGYIEESDEPWHATSTQTVVPNKASLEGSKPEAVKALEAEEAAKIEAGEAKPSVGGMKPGWDGKRSVATTHDNSR